MRLFTPKKKKAVQPKPDRLSQILKLESTAAREDSDASRGSTLIVRAGDQRDGSGASSSCWGERRGIVAIEYRDTGRTEGIARGACCGDCGTGGYQRGLRSGGSTTNAAPEERQVRCGRRGQVAKATVTGEIPGHISFCEQRTGRGDRSGIFCGLSTRDGEDARVGDVAADHKLLGNRGGVGRTIGIDLAVIIGSGEHRQTDGVRGLEAGALLGFLDAIGDRAEGDTGQNGDDPNDHEEFDEGETASFE